METTRERFPAGARAGHELVDHTSEITLRLHAPTFGALVMEATRAFVELVPESMRGPRTAEPREIEVDGPDRAATIVGWLNEMVYLCEAEQWLPVEIEVEEERGSGLRIRAAGVTLSSPFVVVKAATLHRARVEEGPGGVSGEVTLDV